MGVQVVWVSIVAANDKPSEKHKLLTSEKGGYAPAEGFICVYKEGRVQ